ncbi:MAG TPA: AraC family transcriptional regulator [Polyangiaceae bacterium]|nr:AraC family transcriptional regulator [Polyangiaceae bacterium]
MSDVVLAAPRPKRMLASAIAATAFHELGISVSVYSDGVFRTLNVASDFLPSFETEHQTDLPRYRYNERCIRKALATGLSVLGEHRGGWDWFVPVGEPGTLLIAGPFFREQSTSAEIARRWRAVARTQPNLADPSLSRYLATTLATLVLPGALCDEFEQLLACVGKLVCGGGQAVDLTQEVDSLVARLMAARSSEDIWAKVRDMVDHRTCHRWSAPPKPDLERIGLKGPPEHVVVGLLAGRADESDGIDEALRRHACQRSMSEFWRRRGNVVAGQLGSHGLVLVIGPGTRSRPRLVDIVTNSGAVARRFGFRLHAGIARGNRTESLATLHRTALASAHIALSRSQTIAFAEDASAASVRSLGELRADLAAGFGTGSEESVTRFESYAEAVVSRLGYQLEAIQAHLEAGLDRLVEPLLASGALEPRTYRDLTARVRSGPESAQSLGDLLAAYRAVVVDIEGDLKRPVATRRGRSLSRALAFVKEHSSEPLSLAAVAKVAGFAPTYFSRLWKDAQGKTFERSVLEFRLERAKRALAISELGVGRIAALTGFKSRTHFQQVFKHATKMTPLDYRAARQLQPPKPETGRHSSRMRQAPPAKFDE